MIAGHYATALVPYELTRKSTGAPFWLYLLAAQFLDLLMLGLVALGLEELAPHNFLEATFASMHAEMFISHDIVPVLGWAALVGLVVWPLFRSGVVALWCAALVVVHEVSDLLVGFQHYVLGTDTAGLGLNLYQRAPVTGLLIEALLCAGLVYWFCRHRARQGEPVTPVVQWGLYGVLVGSTLATLPLAHHSLAGLLGLDGMF